MGGNTYGFERCHLAAAADDWRVIHGHTAVRLLEADVSLLRNSVECAVSCAEVHHSRLFATVSIRSDISLRTETTRITERYSVSTY
jgi:hypothetical protein